MRRLVLTLSVLLLSAPAQAAPVSMVSGNEAGTYYAIARDIAAISKSNGIEVEVLPSGGSIENIQRIANAREQAGIGIVQSDILGFLNRSTNPRSREMAGKLRMVAPLYAEEVHVLARRQISQFSELTGRRVIIGQEGSGNAITSANLLTLLGVTPRKLYQVDAAEGIVAVLQDRADAVIFTGGKPVRMFKNIEKLADSKDPAKRALAASVHFLPLDDPRLLGEYAPATLTPADYAIVPEAVATVAVKAVLVSYDYAGSKSEERCSQMRTIFQSIKGNMSELRNSGHPKWREVNPEADVALWQRDLCIWPEEQTAATPSSELQSDLFNLASQQGQ